MNPFNDKSRELFPAPFDTSQIRLSDDILKLTELLAKNAHDTWAQQRIALGWRLGPVRDDDKKEHPCLVPYKELPESEKEFDRTAALETVKMMVSLGYSKLSTNSTSDTSFLRGGPEQRNRETIAQIKKPRLTAAELRKIWEERTPLVWLRDVEIYRRGVDAALKLGEAFLAFDIAEEGLTAFRSDLRLIQLQALALARTGATERANELLEQLRSSGHNDEETLGILARTHKDFWLFSVDPRDKRRHLKLSFELYADAYRKNRGYYSGINAAAMGLIYGERGIAYEIARDVADICRAMLEKIDPESEERYWVQATLAESALIQGNYLMAEEYYRNASEFGGQSWVVLNRTRAQARLLLEYSGKDRTLVDHCFKLPRIVVCSGHMFDKLDRKQPRFPHALEARIQKEIRSKLAQMEAHVGFSSLACGADMLFSEAILERGGEANIVLPFRKEDFKASSVEIIPGTTLGERFEKVMENAATVTTLNEMGSANDPAAYEYCNQVLMGLALLKGRFLGLDVMPLAVWDGRLGDGRGGTQSFVEFWEKRRTKVEVIFLDKVLADEVCLVSPAATKEPVEVEVVAPKVEESVSPEVSPQEIKAVLFADIKGYTKLPEEDIPAFVHHFLNRVCALMDSMLKPPIVRNTWGDALHCVFDHVADAGVFALALRDLVRGTDWTAFNLPSDLNIRIALHAGPVYPCMDPVLKKLTFMGSHVNRTARIEPIAEEGQIYASQAFAALSETEGVKEYVCDYVGQKQLAKKYGSIPVFLVRRA
jgi:class 3 adenylate cyclase/tetratricopeptide (TPR) repeat protein